MRVDHVVPYYRPVTGGIETYVESLAQRQIARGLGVTVHTRDRDLAGRPLRHEETVAGVPVRRYHAGVHLGYYTTRFKPQLGADLIHLHAFGSWTHDWVARRHPRAKKVLSLQHAYRIPAPTPLHAAYHWLYRATRGRGTLARMDAIVAYTRHDAELLARARIAEGKVHVIPTGLPEPAFERAAPAPAPEGWDGYFLYVGRLHREKCVDQAIRALRNVPGGFGLLVAGPDQGDGARLRAATRRAGLESRVRFLGPVDDSRKRALMRGARALVLPSRYEAFGIVLVEAWAQGTPVIASAVGGVPHLVADGADGLLYRWGDLESLGKRMNLLASDPSLATRLGESGNEKARREYREEPLLDRIVDLYRSLER